MYKLLKQIILTKILSYIWLQICSPTLRQGNVPGQGWATTKVLQEDVWLMEWNIIQAYAPQYHQLPMKSMEFHTPLVPSSWLATLNGSLINQ